MNYFRKYLKKIKDEYEYSSEYDYPEEVIDINSPYFDELSENGMLEEFSILIPLIPINEIIDLKIKDDYSSVFDKLNQSKSKYSSITLNINNNTNLNNIKQFKIDFKQLKRLTIKPNKIYDINNNINYNFLLEIEKNLIYLNLKCSNYGGNINEDSFLNFDNFISLEHLVLSGFFLKKILTLKLKN